MPDDGHLPEAGERALTRSAREVGAPPRSRRCRLARQRPPWYGHGCMRKLGLGVVVFALVGAAVACGDSPAASGGDASETDGGKKKKDGGAGGSVGDPAPTTTGTNVDCSAKAALSGPQTWSVTHAGVTHGVSITLPSSYDPSKPTPVVINFHGLNMSGSLMDLMSQMSSTANAKGFIAVFPDGQDQSWNGGVCCGGAADKNLDDVGFTRALIDELEAKLCVDAKRVFATGLSTGGFFSHRLACELSDRIAAIAPVAGLMGVFDCAPRRAMSVFQFHGTKDQIVQYSGVPGVPATMDGWKTRSGCGAKKEYLRTVDTHCDRWEGCRDGAEVQLCTVDDGGHTWPGGPDLTFGALGKTTTAISANELMWEFFQRHPMP